jgi:hypothetical protein
MVLSAIIVSMIFLALFLIQKQIEANKDENVYDQTLLMNVLDHHLYKCQDIEIKNQTVFFKYPQQTQQILFANDKVLLNKIDTLNVYAQIVNVNYDKDTGLLNDMQIKIGNEYILLYKKPNFSKSYLLNHKFIDFNY